VADRGLTGGCWRWRRCGHLLEHGRRPLSGLDDHGTQQGWAFRRALEQRCRTEVDREQLARDFPALAEAHRIFTVGGPLKRAEREGRLLAD
jgi:hypothetical protein